MPDQILPNPLRALDANGDPVVGAEMFIYRAETAIPVTTYSDPGESTPHENPILSLPGGVFPQVYYSGGQSLDVDVRESGVSLPGYPSKYTARVASTATGASRTTFVPIENNPATDVQGAIANNTAFQGTFSAAGIDLVTSDTVALMRAVLELSEGAEARATLGLGSWTAEDSTEPLLKAGNLAELADTAVARSNLGLAQFTSAALVYPSSAGILTTAHGLAAAPKLLSSWVVCTSAELGYSVGDVVGLGAASDGDGARNFSTSSDATNIYFISDGSFWISSKVSPHNSEAADPTKWDLYVRGIE